MTRRRPTFWISYLVMPERGPLAKTMISDIILLEAERKQAINDL